MYGYQSVSIPAIKAFHNSSAKIRLLSGPNRGGKTTRGAWELVCFATGYHPIRKAHYTLPNECWAVSLDNKNYGHIVEERLREWLPAGARWFEAKRYFQLPKPWGSRIYLKSAEPGETKFAAAGILAGWFDEGRASMEGPFMETLARVKPGWPLHLFITMTPEDGAGGWTWKKFYDPSSKERFKEAEIFYFTMMDALKRNGGHLDDQTLEDFKAQHPAWKLDAKIYGRPGLMSSDPYFKPHQIDDLQKRCDEPEQCRIETDSAGIVRAIPDSEGDVFILRPPLPGRRYFMPTDVAGGVSRDFTCASILDPIDKAEVAYFKSNTLDPQFATIARIIPLGRLYNKALAIPETNGEHGTAHLSLLREHKYRPIYRRRKWHSMARRYMDEYGWRTNEYGSRNLIYDAWARVLRENEWTIAKDALHEARFVSEADGRPDHPKGMNDDHFFAVGVGLAAFQLKPELGRKITIPQQPAWVGEDAYQYAM